MRFLQTSTCPTVACQPLLFIDRAMEQAEIECLENSQGNAAIFISKVFSKLGLMRNLFRSSIGPVFVSFMGFSESRTFPFAYWNEIVPYCFDCWPAGYERWAAFFERHRVRLAFFSARQSAEYFAERLPKMKAVWLPEATDPLEYDASVPWMERTIDVLELGRKNDAFHDRIEKHLAEAGRAHLFERVKGQIIFPDRAGLVQGMANSKISICFPCSLTHPERSGSVETVTHRYFESIASKCLVLGHAPQELIDLFGYNPIIEVQGGAEFGQIEYLLSNYANFQDLIEQNYRHLLQVGTWNTRVNKLLSVVNDFYDREMLVALVEQ